MKHLLTSNLGIMVRLLPFLVFLLFLFSCSDSSSHKATSKNLGDSVAISRGDTILTTKKTVDTLTRLDSIDKANSNTIASDDNYIQKAVVLKDNSLIWLTANMKLDHRIFGYDKADTKSKKMILLSIFTNDVEGNPFNCQFGSYYQTSDMPDMKLKYISTEGTFIKANILKNDTIEGTVYIDKKWIEFEK